MAEPLITSPIPGAEAFDHALAFLRIDLDLAGLEAYEFDNPTRVLERLDRELADRQTRSQRKSRRSR
jgi:hypothetical protein